MKPSTALDRLVDAGVSIWLDDMSRLRLTTGSLQHLVDDRHVTGMTTGRSRLTSCSVVSAGSSTVSVSARLPTRSVLFRRQDPSLYDTHATLSSGPS